MKSKVHKATAIRIFLHLLPVSLHVFLLIILGVPMWMMCSHWNDIVWFWFSFPVFLFALVIILAGLWELFLFFKLINQYYKLEKRRSYSTNDSEITFWFKDQKLSVLKSEITKANYYVGAGYRNPFDGFGFIEIKIINGDYFCLTSISANLEKLSNRLPVSPIRCGVKYPQIRTGRN
jgi:hypothetical protein